MFWKQGGLAPSVSGRQSSVDLRKSGPYSKHHDLSHLCQIYPPHNYLACRSNHDPVHAHAHAADACSAMLLPCSPSRAEAQGSPPSCPVVPLLRSSIASISPSSCCRRNVEDAPRKTDGRVPGFRSRRLFAPPAGLAAQDANRRASQGHLTQPASVLDLAEDPVCELEASFESIAASLDLYLFLVNEQLHSARRGRTSTVQKASDRGLIKFDTLCGFG